MNPSISEAYVFVDDITYGQETVKISFINKKSSQTPLSCVTYVPNNTLTSESLADDFESVPLPCKCQDSCGATCSCGLGSNIAYQNAILVGDYFEDISKPIIECSTLCSCENCPNRVVQNGIKIQLQVFMSEHKGFGVRTLEFIPKFTFICEYAGELIDKAEALRRLKRQRKGDPNYIYILNEYSSENSNTCTIIDPTYNGNVGRYLNHSCSPNLIPVPVRANSMLPRICFFAKNDIRPYEELTYNYGTNVSQKREVNLPPHMKSNFEVVKKKCYCNNKECLGFLPFDDILLC